MAVAAAQAVDHVGLPEAQWALAQAAVYLALAPKSKEAYHALKRARASVRDRGAQVPPPYLRSAGGGANRALGRTEGYDDPHEHPGHVSGQELLPDSLVGERFYRPEGQEEIGSGLGLSIVRRIAALHGLGLRFERRDGGRGLRVRVGA